MRVIDTRENRDRILRLCNEMVIVTQTYVYFIPASLRASRRVRLDRATTCWNKVRILPFIFLVTAAMGSCRFSNQRFWILGCVWTSWPPPPETRVATLYLPTCQEISRDWNNYGQNLRSVITRRQSTAILMIIEFTLFPAFLRI